MEQSDVGAFTVIEELSQVMLEVVPGDTTEQKTENLLMVVTLWLSGLIASMPEGVGEEVQKKVFEDIDTTVAYIKAHNESPAPEA